MNYTRIVIAAVAGTVADMTYGFVVYGMLLANQFGQYPGVYRPAEDMSYMPILAAGAFLAVLAATFIYAKGYEGRSGVEEGLRFGAVIGLFGVGYAAMVNYAVLNIGRRLAVSMAAAGFGEWLVVGLVIGLVYKPVYKPAAAPSRRAAGV
jgi:hypothetical protein